MNYIYSNNAERISQNQGIRQSRKKIIETRKQKKQMIVSEVFYFLFLCGCFLILTYNIFFLLETKATYVSTLHKISSLEKEFTLLKTENDNRESELKSNIDIDLIKAKAIQELNMSYPKENQIVYIQDLSDEYVKQIRKIPNN